MADTTPVDYGQGTHWASQDAVAAATQAATEAYQKELIRSGNRDLAEKAANDAATQARDLIQIYGNQAIQAMQNAAQTGLGVANLLASLQGPANAFAYDRAINGINGPLGLSNSIGALTGAYHPTSFQAMGPTSPMTLNSLGQDTSGGNSSIIDQMLGVASNATNQQGQVQSGKLPFSIPQYDANGSGNSTGGQQPTTNGQASTGGTTSGGQTVGQSQQPATVTNNYHYYGDSGSTAPPGATTPGAGQTGLGAPPSGLTTAAGGAYQSQVFQGDKGNPSSWSTATPTAAPGSQLYTSPTGGGYAGTAPGPGGIASFANAPGPTGFSMGGTPLPSTPSNPMGTPKYSPQVQAYLNALPNVNDVNVKGFNQLDPYSKQLTLSGFAAKGYDPTQLQYRFAQQLPQFKSPQFSMVG